jgi:hypothetical protein
MFFYRSMHDENKIFLIGQLFHSFEVTQFVW